LPRTWDKTHKERVPFIMSLNNVASDIVPASAGCLCDAVGVLVARTNCALWQSRHIFTNTYGGHCCYSDVLVLRWNCRVRFELGD